MKNSVLFAVLVAMVAFINTAVAQTVATHMEARDAIGRADLAAEGAIAAFDQFFAQKLELEAKVLSAEKIALAAAARGDARLERKMNEKLDGFRAELAKLDGRIKTLEEKMTAGCRGYADSAAQTACLKTLEAITAGGEKTALETFERVGTPVPAEKVEQTVENKKTTTEKFAPGAQVPYKKMVRCSLGETPVCTTMTVGEQAPIPPIRFVEEGSSDATSWILWLGGGAATGALIGAGVGGFADESTLSPESYGSGGAGYGALIGAGTGMAVAAIIKLAR